MARVMIATTLLVAVLALPAFAPQQQDQERLKKLEMRVTELEVGDKFQKRIAELELHVAILEAYLKKVDPKFGPAMERGLSAAKVAECGNNLRQLWTLQMVYMSQFGGRLKAMPTATGSSFWLALTKTEPPLLDETELEVLICPFSGQKPRPGFTTYRGPAVNVNKLAADDAVGCCEPGHHPDGSINVLKKNGEVVTVAPTEALFKKAVDGTAALPADGKK
jgi:hypothetical protein